MTHDQTTPAPVDVTQADREAAQALMDRWEFGDLHCDDFVEAFARHRIAHSAPAGEVEPVAWMYHHADLQEYEFIKTQALRDRCKQAGYFPADAGWTETPLYTHPAPPADLVEAAKHAIFVFDTYAENHAAKGTAEGKLKAERNRQEAGRLRAALAKHGGA